LIRPASIHARPHHSLECLAQDVAVTKATMAVDRERRVIRHLVVEIEAAKPLVRKVKFEFFAQPPLETDAVAIADDQHPDSLKLVCLVVCMVRVGTDAVE
jgi:hypothetical protein